MQSGAALLILAGVALLLLGGGGAVPVVHRLAEAIAWAEGFYVSGSRPQRNNNPGNVTYDFGFSTVGQDGPFPVFATVEDGWGALRRQLEKIFERSSSFYFPEMTIREMAEVYTATQQAEWAKNVSSKLGVTVNARLMDL